MIKRRGETLKWNDFIGKSFGKLLQQLPKLEAACFAPWAQEWNSLPSEGQRVAGVHSVGLENVTAAPSE